MPRALALTLLLFSALTCSGCLADRQGLSKSEIELVAWYAEDVAHDLPRDPQELLTPDPSHGMAAIAHWARGTVRDGKTIVHPKRLQKRKERWGLMESGLRKGWLLRTDDGLLRLAPHLNAELLLLLAEAMHQENLERLELAHILLARGKLQRRSERGQVLVEALTKARVHHDAATGGAKWQEPDAPSPSNSETEATTSTSEPAP